MYGKVAPQEELKRDDIKGLFYMCSLKNLENILRVGILSHNEVRKRFPGGVEDISNGKVQDRRDDRDVNGKPLHDYVNFYLNPHNAMMYVARDKGLCVLELSDRLLETPGAFITTKNASIGLSVEGASPEEFRMSPISSARATSPRSFVLGEHKQGDKKRKNVRQAEALIPGPGVDINALRRILVANDKIKDQVEKVVKAADLNVVVEVKPSLFFEVYPFSGAPRPIPSTSPLTTFYKSALSESGASQEDSDTDEDMNGDISSSADFKPIESAPGPN